MAVLEDETGIKSFKMGGLLHLRKGYVLTGPPNIAVRWGSRRLRHQFLFWGN